MRKWGIIIALVFIPIGSWILIKTQVTRKGSSQVTKMEAVTKPDGVTKPEEVIQSEVSLNPELGPRKNSNTPSQRLVDSHCYSFEYRPSEESAKREIEDFLDFSSAFPVLHDRVDPKSICVKVNGKGVDTRIQTHQKHQEILIGSVIGPESLIRVSYCTGTSTCKEACPKPKKRFMDDLLNDAQADELQDSWGKDSQDANTQELRNRAKELNAIAKEDAALNGQTILRDWKTTQTQEWACREKQ
jgi:hypothetical protein